MSTSNMAAKRIATDPVSPPPVVEAEQPPPKKRKKSVTAKSLGLSKEEYSRIKATMVKKELKVHAKALRQQVEADWHNGWEVHAEITRKWVHALHGPLQAVLDIGVGKGLAFLQCHDVLRTIGDSWRDLRANPVRMDFQQMIGERCEVVLSLPWGEEKKFYSFFNVCPLKDMCGYVWRLLLRGAAAADAPRKVPENVLLQAVKDATDNGVLLASSEVNVESFVSTQEAADIHGEQARDAKQSSELNAAALDDLVARKEEWMRLDSTIRTYRQRRLVSRQIERPPLRGSPVQSTPDPVTPNLTTPDPTTHKQGTPAASTREQNASAQGSVEQRTPDTNLSEEKVEENGICASPENGGDASCKMQ